MPFVIWNSPLILSWALKKPASMWNYVEKYLPMSENLTIDKPNILNTSVNIKFVYNSQRSSLLTYLYVAHSIRLDWWSLFGLTASFLFFLAYSKSWIISCQVDFFSVSVFFLGILFFFNLNHCHYSQTCSIGCLIAFKLNFHPSMLANPNSENFWLIKPFSVF